MIGKDVIFDQENRRVGFADSDCIYPDTDRIENEENEENNTNIQTKKFAAVKVCLTGSRQLNSNSALSRHVDNKLQGTTNIYGAW